jgi:uncharacterized coiled-coil DUF342 family protein
MKPTPETNKFFATFADGEVLAWHAEYYARLQDLERERDEWKAKFIQQNKDLGCEMMDPNGTIWDHAKTLQRERDDLQKAVNGLCEHFGVSPANTTLLAVEVLKIERERDEARDTVESLTTTASDLLTALGNARNERDEAVRSLCSTDYPPDTGDDSLYNVRRLRARILELKRERDEARGQRDMLAEALKGIAGMPEYDQDDPYRLRNKAAKALQSLTTNEP